MKSPKYYLCRGSFFFCTELGVPNKVLILWCDAVQRLRLYNCKSSRAVSAQWPASWSRCCAWVTVDVVTVWHDFVLRRRHQTPSQGTIGDFWGTVSSLRCEQSWHEDLIGGDLTWTCTCWPVSAPPGHHVNIEKGPLCILQPNLPRPYAPGIILRCPIVVCRWMRTDVDRSPLPS